jgi:hypothetical protein
MFNVRLISLLLASIGISSVANAAEPQLTNTNSQLTNVSRDSNITPVITPTNTDGIQMRLVNSYPSNVQPPVTLEQSVYSSSSNPQLNATRPELTMQQPQLTQSQLTLARPELSRPELTVSHPPITPVPMQQPQLTMQPMQYSNANSSFNPNTQQLTIKGYEDANVRRWVREDLAQRELQGMQTQQPQMIDNQISFPVHTQPMQPQMQLTGQYQNYSAMQPMQPYNQQYQIQQYQAPVQMPIASLPPVQNGAFVNNYKGSLDIPFYVDAKSQGYVQTSKVTLNPVNPVANVNGYNQPNYGQQGYNQSCNQCYNQGYGQANFAPQYYPEQARGQFYSPYTKSPYRKYR